MRGVCQWQLGPSMTMDNTGILNRNQREKWRNHSPVVLKKNHEKNVTNKGCLGLLGDTNACLRYFRHGLILLLLQQECFYPATQTSGET